MPKFCKECAPPQYRSHLTSLGGTVFVGCRWWTLIFPSMAIVNNNSESTLGPIHHCTSLLPFRAGFCGQSSQGKMFSDSQSHSTTVAGILNVWRTKKDMPPFAVASVRTSGRILGEVGSNGLDICRPKLKSVLPPRSAVYWPHQKMAPNSLSGTWIGGFATSLSPVTPFWCWKCLGFVWTSFLNFAIRVTFLCLIFKW